MRDTLLNGDLLDQLAGIQPGSAAAAVRDQRPEVRRHTQGSYAVLLDGAEALDLPRYERELIALRVAILSRSAPLIEHYQQRLTTSGVAAETIAAVADFPAAASLSPRLAAILRHVDRMTSEPRTAAPEHLAELQAHGLSTRAIVILAQLVAFLTYQVRVVAGLQLLNAG